MPGWPRPIAEELRDSRKAVCNRWRSGLTRGRPRQKLAVQGLVRLNVTMDLVRGAESILRQPRL